MGALITSSSALCRFSIALSPPARHGLWASLRHPVSRGFRRASARGHRKMCLSLFFPAHAHFNTFCVLFLEVACDGQHLSTDSSSA